MQATSKRQWRRRALACAGFAAVAALAGAGAEARAGAPSSWIAQPVAADDGASNDRFGSAVAVAGATAAIGAPDAQVGGNYDQGAAYVFVADGGVWTQAQKLVADDGAGQDDFGSAVALAGSTLFVSAPGARIDGHSAQGAVYVFAEADGAWTPVQKLVAGDGGTGDNFGNAIAVSGATMLVAAKGATVGGNALQGAVYVFTETDGAWSERQKLVAADGAGNDLFGASVALDGGVALVGAPTLSYNFLHAGWTYAFAYDAAGGTWTQTQKLMPDDSAIGDQFGYVVALSGGVALIGATGNQFAHGAAYAFAASDAGWTQAQKLMPAEGGSGDEFGNALALAGATALVGADRLAVGDHQGAAFAFAAADGAWSETDELSESDGGSLDFFGSALALDGATALVGTPGATVGDAAFQGVAYFFARPDAPLAPEVAKRFAPDSVPAGVASTATIVLTNANAAPATLTADLVDALPDGLTASSVETSCDGAASFTAGTLALAAGATIPAAGSCEIDATVQAAAAGSYVNTIAAGALVTDAGSNASAASATLTVTPASRPPQASVTPDALALTAAADARAEATLTIADAAGSDALHFSIAARDDTDGSCGGAAVAWLSAAPDSGAVDGGAAADVAVTAAPAAGGLAPGQYAADLCITTDDPEQPTIAVPVELTVTPAGGDRIFCDGFEDGEAGACAARGPLADALVRPRRDGRA